MGTLGVRRVAAATVVDMARASHDALARPLAHAAELHVGLGGEEGVLLGAFQRLPDAHGREPVARRATGGAAVRVGPGSLHVVLALPSPSALTPCTEDQILNRYVRPLLRALTKTGALAHYFGRDWISVAHRPAGWVGFGHVRATARTVFEAVVAVTTPFHLSERASFGGKPPITLAELGVRRDDHADEIVRAYAAAFGLEPQPIPASATSALTGAASVSSGSVAPVSADPPWAACVEEAIGPVCAGRDASGRLRVGGELMASSDAVGDLENRLAAPGALTAEAVGAAVDAAFTVPHTALFGVRALASLRDAVLAALRHGDPVP